MGEFIFGLLLSLLLSLVLYFLLPAVFAITWAYWLCLVISLVLVYGGFFIMGDGDFTL